MKLHTLLILIVAISWGTITGATEPSAAPTVPVMPRYRLRMGETETDWLWRETMTDGTVRDSKIPKPKPARQPVRATLIATNDIGWAWRFDYEVGHNDGSVATNASFRPKPPRARLAPLLDLRRPPLPGDPITTVHTALAKERDVRHRAAGLTMVRKATPSGIITNYMQSRIYVKTTTPIDHNHVELRYSDGAVTTQSIQRIIGAPIATLASTHAPTPPPPPSPPSTTAVALISLLSGAGIGAATSTLSRRHT